MLLSSSVRSTSATGAIRGLCGSLLSCGEDGGEDNFAIGAGVAGVVPATAPGSDGAVPLPSVWETCSEIAGAVGVGVAGGVLLSGAGAVSAAVAAGPGSGWAATLPMTF